MNVPVSVKFFMLMLVFIFVTCYGFISDEILVSIFGTISGIVSGFMSIATMFD